MGSPTADPIAATLLAVLDNQVARTHAALSDLPQHVFDAAQPNACNSIRAIGAHLIDLRRFQLGMLGSQRRAGVAPADAGPTPDTLRVALEDAAAQVRAAILEHDPTDWFTAPETPREGKWGDEATMHRFARPFNDYVSHLGAIRALRRQLGSPAERTQ